MEHQTINDILNAVEDLEDMIPLLERQDGYNKVIVSHSVQALRDIFNKYHHEAYYGITESKRQGSPAAKH